MPYTVSWKLTKKFTDGKSVHTLVFNETECDDPVVDMISWVLFLAEDHDGVTEIAVNDNKVWIKSKGWLDSFFLLKHSDKLQYEQQ